MKKLWEYIRRKVHFILHGYMMFYNEAGNYHRVNGPAMEWRNGDYSWFYNGEVHRYYGPAACWRGKPYYWIFGRSMI